MGLRIVILISLFSSLSMANVENLNTVINEASTQERLLHRKLLQSIQDTQVAIAVNDRREHIQDQERVRNPDILVRLVSDQHSHD